MLLYLIDALYVDRYMLHRPFDQQGLKQAANANGLILHTDMFRVARRLKFDQVEWEAKQQLIGFINFFSASASSNPVFLEALIWLYSNLDPGDWEIRRVFCFWLAYGLKSFGQPMRDDIVTASQMLPLFKSDLKEKLREVPGFNVPGFTI